VKTRNPHPGLLQIAILFPFLLIQTSHLLPWIHFYLSLLPSIILLYYTSYLVEVLLRLLTCRGDLVLLYLVSEYYS
jgi:recombinational DNA repair protein (RecF pathway)